MSEHNELIPSEKNELLNIFTEEEDKKGTDLLAMSDFLKCSLAR